MIRTYHELVRYETFEQRFKYLLLGGRVGRATFGFDRYINQQFYTSKEWRAVRRDVISRDNGCDLGIEGLEIHQGLYIHHMNPITIQDVREGNESILDPEFLITVTHETHNAIHYGAADHKPNRYIPRTPNDTKLW